MTAEAPSSGRRKLTRNRCKCKLCGDIIESRFRHDFKKCKCGSIFTDGGLGEAIRRGFLAGKDENDIIEDMCEYVELEEEDGNENIT